MYNSQYSIARGPGHREPMAYAPVPRPSYAPAGHHPSARGYAPPAVRELMPRRPRAAEYDYEMPTGYDDPYSTYVPPPPRGYVAAPLHDTRPLPPSVTDLEMELEQLDERIREKQEIERELIQMVKKKDRSLSRRYQESSYRESHSRQPMELPESSYHLHEGETIHVREPKTFSHRGAAKREAPRTQRDEGARKVPKISNIPVDQRLGKAPVDQRLGKTVDQRLGRAVDQRLGRPAGNTASRLGKPSIKGRLDIPAREPVSQRIAPRASSDRGRGNANPFKSSRTFRKSGAPFKVDDDSEFYHCKRCPLKYAPGGFPCEDCGEQFNAHYNLVKHMLEVHGIENEVQCDLCSSRFPSVTQYKKHLLQHHHFCRVHYDVNDYLPEGVALKMKAVCYDAPHLVAVMTKIYQQPFTLEQVGKSCLDLQQDVVSPEGLGKEAKNQIVFANC